MSSLYGPMSIVPGATLSVHVSGYPDSGAVVVFNESPYFVTVSLLGGQTRSIPAYTADILVCEQGFNGGTTITSQSYLTTGTQAPSYVVFLMTLGSLDPLVQALVNGGNTGYPMSLPRLQSVGNAIAVSGGSVTANTLINNTQSGATAIINVQAVENLIGSNFLFDAGGVCTMSWYDEAGHLYQYFFMNGLSNGVILGNTNINTTINGLNTYFSSPLSSLSGSDLYLNANGSTQKIHFQVNGVNYALLDSTTAGLQVSYATVQQINGMAGVNLFLNALTGQSVVSSVNGVGVLTVAGNLVTSTQPIQVNSVKSDGVTDLSLNANKASGILHLQSNGTDVVTVAGNLVTSTQPIQVNSVKSDGVTDLTLNANKASGILHMQSNGTDVVTVAGNLVTSTQPIQVNTVKSAGATDLTLNANQTSGIIHLQSNGVDALTVSNVQIATSLVIQSPNFRSPGSSDITISASQAGGIVHLQSNGTDVVTVSNTSVTSTQAVTAPKVVFSATSAGSLSGFGTFTGTGPGIFNHGCPSTPYRVWFTVNAGTAVPISYDGLTSTQVNVHIAAGNSWFGFWYLQ